MPAEEQPGRIARRAAERLELHLVPIDADVGIGAALEQLPRELEARDLARRLRRRRRELTGAAGAIRRARLTQPGDRVQRRRARIGPIRVGAMREQHARHFVVSVDDRDVQRGRAVGRQIVRIGALLEQQPNRIELGIADCE